MFHFHYSLLSQRLSFYFLLLQFLLDVELNFWRTLQKYLTISESCSQCWYFALDTYGMYRIGNAQVS